MYIFGDIGNSETKLFLVNKKEKILKRINLPTNYINDRKLHKKIKFLTKNINDIEKILKFWKMIGSRTIIMKPDVHDRIFSITSHLPHLISYNLIKTALDFQKKYKKNIIKYSAGGLRDFSRTAASNEIMWRDIFFSNKKNMLKAINLFIKNLNQFKKNIINSENTKILKKLTNSKKVRRQIIELKQDVSKPDFGREDN